MKTIDLTPTWESLIPIIIAVLQDGTEAGKKEVTEELTRMAQIADRFVEVEKHTKKRIEILEEIPRNAIENGCFATYKAVLKLIQGEK